MKISKTLFHGEAIDKDFFAKLSDELCLLAKVMPQTDDKLQEYIDGINKAREAGINIAEIVDYELLPNATTDINGNKYTRGIFLERLAKGKSNAYNVDFIDTDKATEEEFNSKAANYIVKLQEYVNTIEERAAMDQMYYDKFVQDCIELEKYGIAIDPKPSNFFIDVNEGVTIIDPIPKNQKSSVVDDEYFSSYVMVAILGYGRPMLYINDVDYSFVSMEMKTRMTIAYSQIDAKIAQALMKANVNRKLVRNALDKHCIKYEFNKISDKNVMNYLIDAYLFEAARKPEVDKAKKEERNLIW